MPFKNLLSLIELNPNLRSLDSPSKNADTPKAELKKEPASSNIYGTLENEPTTKRQLFYSDKNNSSMEQHTEKRDLDFYKDQNNFKSIILNQNDAGLNDCKNDLSSSKSGLLFISLKKLSSLTSAVHIRTLSSQFRSEQNLSDFKKPIIYQSNSDFARTIESLKRMALTPLKSDPDQGQEKRTEAIEDPLNAFNLRASPVGSTQQQEQGADKLRKKLFDYKPFEKELASKEKVSQAVIGVTAAKSDFLFERPADVANLVRDG